MPAKMSVVLHAMSVVLALLGLVAAIAWDWEWRALGPCSLGVLLTVPSQNDARWHQYVVGGCVIACLIVVVIFI